MPSRFLVEIPPELMHGPRLVVQDDDDEDQRPADERGRYDLSTILGRGAGTRLVGRRSWAEGRAAQGQRILPPGGGFVPPPGAPAEGETFRPSRDLAARRDAYWGAKSAIGLPDDPTRGLGPGDGQRELGEVPPRPIVPGERRYRDGDRVRHRSFGDGTVVTSKLTREDEEVTVAFPDKGVKKLMASLANLELVE